MECLLAYAPFEPSERIGLDTLLELPQFEETKTMIKTIYEEGMESGLERERRRNVERLIVKRFKLSDGAVRQQLAKYNPEELDNLFERAVDAVSLEDLGLVE